MRRLLILAFLLLLPALARAQQTVFVPNCAGSNDTAVISALISLIGSNQGTISLPYKSGTRCAVNALTIPANVTLDNTQGSGIKVNTGQTLTVAGPINSPPGKQLFYNATAGLGTVSFSGKAIANYYPEWWGATGLGVANEQAPIQATITAAQSTGGVVNFSGTYLLSGSGTAVPSGGGITAFLLITSSVTLQGSPGAMLKVASSVGATVDVIHVAPPAGYVMKELRILDLNIQPVSGSPARDGIRLSTLTAGSQIRNALIRGNVVGGQIIGSSTVEFGGNGLYLNNNGTLNPGGAMFIDMFEGNTFYGGVTIANAGDSLHFIGNTIASNVVDRQFYVNLMPGCTGPNFIANNMTQGGGVRVVAALNPVFIGNIIEQANASLSTVATLACLDFNGEGQLSQMDVIHPYVVGNVFVTDAVNVMDGVRLNRALDGYIAENNFQINAAKSILRTTSSATRTSIGKNSSIATFSTTVTDGSTTSFYFGPPMGYTNAGLAGTYVAAGGGLSVPAYQKVGGWVKLRGTATGGAVAPSQITVLPTTMWPAGNIRFNVPANGATGVVEVRAADGTVWLIAGSSTDVSLDGIQFIAGQ